MTTKRPEAAPCKIYGEKLTELGAVYENIVMLDADLMRSNGTIVFQQRFPERSFNMGIAEQNLMAVSAGLALNGKMPYLSTFTSFGSMRAFEQIRTDIAYHNLKVRIVTTHCGMTGNSGATHAGVEDLALMRTIPNMTVVAPGDPNQIRKALDASVHLNGPMYMRIGAKTEPLVYDSQDYTFELGKGIVLREGKDAAIIACSAMVAHALDAADLLAAEGKNVAVVDMHTIKPLDKELILSMAEKTGFIVTAEDHIRIGGLGSAVAEVLADNGANIRLLRLGVPDVFVTNGSVQQLYQKFGLDAEGLARSIAGCL